MRETKACVHITKDCFEHEEQAKDESPSCAKILVLLNLRASPRDSWETSKERVKPGYEQVDGGGETKERRGYDCL